MINKILFPVHSFQNSNLRSNLNNFPKVIIIILNWNGKDDTIECLESLSIITYPNYEIILVDNGSTDGSVNCFIEKYSEIEIIKNKENLGFAEGNNIGMRHAIEKGADYILLLNNDTVVDSEFLNELVKVAESDPKIGIVGPKIYYYNYKGRKDVIWFAGGKIHWRFGKTAHLHMDKIDKGSINKLIQVDYITGCAILLNKNLLDKIGLFDPEYFAYFEEVDLCVRASRFYSCIFVPKAIIWHKVSRSTGGNFSPTMAYLFIRNKMLFMMKNGPKSMIKRIIFLGFHSEYSIRKLIIYLLIGKKEVVKSIYSGFIDSLKIFHRFFLIIFLLY